MNQSCGTICCPRCGYEYVTHSATVDWVRRLARGGKDLLLRVAARAKKG